jgi:hypothetical protein
MRGRFGVPLVDPGEAGLFTNIIGLASGLL